MDWLVSSSQTELCRSVTFPSGVSARQHLEHNTSVEPILAKDVSSFQSKDPVPVRGVLHLWTMGGKPTVVERYGLTHERQGVQF